MKILILGGCGRQGKVIASDLARKYDVITADISSDADIVGNTDYKTLIKLMPKYDLVVGALPSAFGRDTMMAAIDCGVNYVDVSFLSHNVSDFNSTAIYNGVTIFHDCGIAPGISHLVTGMAIRNGAKHIKIFVGDVAKDKKDDYVITWSPEDLYEEYTRPARVIRNGKVETIPALSNIRSIHVPLGLQAYITDGLRSLLSKADLVDTMEEYTWRWPGHIERIEDLLESEEKFVSGLKERFREDNSDKLVLQVVANRRPVTMTVYGDEQMSAMAKTTALACSAFVQLLASGKYNRTGVIAPEDIAMDDSSYKFILDCISEHGIEFDVKYPFMEE